MVLFWFGVGDMEKLLDFWVVFLSIAVLFVCNILRQRFYPLEDVLVGLKI